MSDPTSPTTIDVTPTAPRAPSTTGEAEATYYFAGRVSQTTTSERGGATTRTSDIGVVGGVRYTSGDRNGNGTADRTLDAGGFYSQSTLSSRYGVQVEARQELSRSASVFGRVQASNEDVQAVVGLQAEFGGGSRPSRDPAYEAERALDRELRDVYRDPEAVRERLDTLDRGTDPRGLTFGEIAGRLYAPQASGLVSEAGDLTARGASEAERFETLGAYATYRQAQLTPLTQGPYGADYARLVQGKEAILGGFRTAYGDAWPAAYGAFNAALRSEGVDRAIEGLPPSSDPAAVERLTGALKAQNASDARFPEGMVTGAREQAEINQFRRDAGAAPEATAPVRTQTQDLIGPER